MPAGRPTKYTPELLVDAHAYIDDWEGSEEEIIPSHVGLADSLDITRKTLYEWAKEESKAEFCDILDKIQRRQEIILISKGLTKQFDSGLTKLVLGKHGYHDKVDNTLTGSDGGPVQITAIELVAPKPKKEEE